MLTMLLLQAAVSYTAFVFPAGTVDPTLTAPVAILSTFTALDCGPLVVPGDGQTFRVTASWPAQGGATCQSPPIPVTAIPTCLTAPCAVYAVFIKASDGSWSAAALPWITTSQALDPSRPECSPPLGNRAVAVFPTGVQTTGSGGPGSRARANYQLASPNSPITEIRVRIDGTVAEQPTKGDQLLDTAGLWFTMPASGTHSLTIQAVNAYGCSREVAGPPLTVP